MITVTEIEITDANSIEGATDHCWRQFGGAYPWWRGHAVFSWKLQASVHRPMPGAKGGVNFQYEVDINANFRQRARPRYPKCPDDSNYAAWLFLMQHYGLPTRLMDRSF